MDRNSRASNKEIKKGLYLVPTPIGNLGDITLRAIDTLKKSDIILCEDTRVSKKLLEKHQIKTELISNHKFNEKKNIPKFLKLLKNGSVVSLISDAGTPTVSDPGTVLVNECIKNKITIIPLPGASSVLTAISVSGFSGKFYFYGFFPEKKKVLDEDMKFLSELSCSVVFFVSSKKFKRFYPSIKKNFAGRKLLICREMTKYYEEFIRSEINDIEETDLDLKGELTLVISDKKSVNKNSQNLDESDKRMIRQMINKLSTKEIINIINRDNKFLKKEIYNYCLRLKNET